MSYFLFKQETILHMECVNLAQWSLKCKYSVILHKPGYFSHLLGFDLMWGKKAKNIRDSMENLGMHPCLWVLGSELVPTSHVWEACYQVEGILWEGCGVPWWNVGQQRPFPHSRIGCSILVCLSGALASYYFFFWHDMDCLPHSNSRREWTLAGCFLSHDQL